jgi:hypothetical protein
MERRMGGKMKGGWQVSELAPVLLRGNVNKDLTKRENWTFSSEMSFRDVVDDKNLEWFGVPFYDTFYPETKVYKSQGQRRGFHPIGWLEGNVVQITDPKHLWYDPEGKTFHIFLRAHTGKTDLACMLKAVEKNDGTIETMLQKAPSGKKQLYLPYPGGHIKFSVAYDEKTELYWSVSNQATDSMTRPESLSSERNGMPYNQRSRLQLHFSKNMVDWCFAGLVAVGPSERSARSYPHMIIHKDDLLIMSRSGDMDAKNAHDGNLITFHRIKDFRKLVY